MPPFPLRASRLGAAVLAGALCASSAAVAQSSACRELARLDERIAAVRTGASPAATRSELEELEGYREVARRVAEGGDAEVCAVVVEEALGVARGVERLSLVLTDRLEDAELRSADGRDMGEIEELVIDPQSGRIAYGIVEIGGFLGLGERYFPVPWSLFEATPDADAFVLHVERDRLTNAPQFTPDNRPDMADRRWALAVHTYYGVDPYWLGTGSALAAIGRAATASGGSPRTPAGSGSGSEPPTPSAPQAQPPQAQPPQNGR